MRYLREKQNRTIFKFSAVQRTLNCACENEKFIAKFYLISNELIYE